jgi:hypothetical protein
MKQLPKKWAIKTYRPEFFEWLLGKCGSVPVDKSKYIHYIDLSFAIKGKRPYWYTSETLDDDPLITFEDWAAVYRPDLLTPERKIIGYRAPFDMYKGLVGEIKKGDLFTYDHNAYVGPQRRQGMFPCELVESFFEPVYEEGEPKYELIGDLFFMDEDSIRLDYPSGHIDTISNWVKRFAGILTAEDIEKKTDWFKRV